MHYPTNSLPVFFAFIKKTDPSPLWILIEAGFSSGSDGNVPLRTAILIRCDILGNHSQSTSFSKSTDIKYINCNGIYFETNPGVTW